MTSFEANNTRQFTLPFPDSKNVSTFSSRTRRTSPVAASLTKSWTCLWSREVETNASCLLSSLQWTSAHSPPQTM